MSTLWPPSSNGSEIASAIRRAIALDLGGRLDFGKEQSEFVAGQPREQRAAGQRFAELGGDDHPQAVGDHDQQLVAAGMAEAVVDQLEAVEIDEQHRRLACLAELAEQFVGLGAEMQAVGQRRDRIVHAQRMGILDRCADFGEQGVDGGGELGHRLADRRRRRRDQIAVLDREQAVAKRGQGARALAVGALGGDVADQQAEDAGDERGDDLLVELGDVEQRRRAKRRTRRSRPRPTGARC